MSVKPQIPQTPLYEALVNQSFAPVDFPISSAQIQTAMASFFAFLELPDEIKNHIKISISETHRRGDVGFTHRTPKDRPFSDSKDFFHYHPALLEPYEDFIHDQPVVAQFVAQAQPIWQAVYDRMKDVLSALEPYGNQLVSRVLNQPKPHILLRFLRYHWQEAGRHLAKPHFDAGAFTLAIAESEPGLRIGKDPETLKPVDHQSHQALFMLSGNCDKLIHDPTLHPGWHDVIQLDEKKIGQPYARWALVAFIEAANVTAPSRDQTHRWI